MTDRMQTGIHKVQSSNGRASAPRKERLLIVEDNPEMQKLLHYFLSTRWEVFAAFDLQTALELATDQRFEAVLMDINLGEGTTGLDGLRAIRQTTPNASTPVVAVTAYALPGDRERFLSDGFDGYIAKPFARQQLEDVIATVIQTM